MAAYDLHIHSGYSSDGELPVAAIVGLCADRGLDAFSLTDHNSVPVSYTHLTLPTKA